MTGPERQVVPQEPGDFMRRAREESIARLKQQQQTSALNVFEAASASELNPDLEARATRMAKRLGIPRIQVPEDREVIDRLERDQDLRSLLVQFPHLHTAMQDVPRVRMMADDLGNLKTVAGAFDWFHRNYDAGAMMNEAGRLGAASAFRDLTPAEQDRLREIDELQAIAAPFRAAAAQLGRRFLEKGAEKLTAATAASALRTFVTEYAKAVGAEVGTETMQEALAVMSERIAASLEGVKGDSGDVAARFGEIAWKTFQGMSVLGLFGPAAHYASDLRRVHGAQVFSQKLEKDSEAAAASKQRERDPDGYGAVVDAMAAGKPGAVVHIDAQKLDEAIEKSGESRAAFAQAMPDVAKQLEQAKKSPGADVTMTIGQWNAHVATTTLFEQLRPHVRAGENALSEAEAQELRQNQERYRDDAIARAEFSQSAREDFDASAARVEKRIKQQLQATGMMDGKNAVAAAKLHRTFVETLAAKLKVSPEEVDRRYPLQVKADRDMPQLPPHLFDREGNVRTDTPEFRGWFGASKMVDKEGQPLTFYHGTHGEFVTFDRLMAAKKFGRGTVERPGMDALGVWVSSEPGLKGAGMYGPNVMPLHVRAENPYQTTWEELEALGKRLTPEAQKRGKAKAGTILFDANKVREHLRAQGYDSIEFTERNIDGGDHRVVVVFDENQIKSTNNRGTWSRETANILEQLNQRPDFYSALSRELEALPTKASSAAGWKQAIAGLVNKGKVKREEVVWSGLEDWLELQQGEVTEAQVAEFLAANGVRVETIRKTARKSWRISDVGGGDWGEGFETEEAADAYMRTRARELAEEAALTITLPKEGDELWVVTGEDASGNEVYEEFESEEDARWFVDEDVSRRERQWIDEAHIHEDGQPQESGSEWVFRGESFDTEEDALEALRKAAIDDAATPPEPMWPAEVEADGELLWVIYPEEFKEREYYETEAEAQRAFDADHQKFEEQVALYVAAHRGEVESAVAGEDATRYNEYQLPNGENYREILVTLPSPLPKLRAAVEAARMEVLRLTDELEVARIRGNRAELEAQLPAARQRARETSAALQAAARAEYLSPHWDEPNVLAHLRLNDRIDKDGKRVLFVEEIQSDWAQKGRKDGFVRNESAAEIEAAADAFVAAGVASGHFVRNHLTPAVERRRWVEERNRANRALTPRAPFVDSTKGWLNLALKKVLMLAVEGGYDKVAFINGKQSVDRYQLSKKVESIAVSPDSSGNRVVLLTLVLGGKWTLDVGADGKVASGRREFVGKDLADVVGKEIATRIMQASGETTLRADDLKIGGEGMMAFYDEIVPQAAAKLAKKLGGETATAYGDSSQHVETVMWSPDSGFFEAVPKRGGDPIVKANVRQQDLPDLIGKEAAQRLLEAAPDQQGMYQGYQVLQGEDLKIADDQATEAFALEVTEQLRESVAAGLPLFAEGAKGRRGGYDPRTWMALLYEKADASTFLHESAHYYLHVYSDLAADPNAPESVRADMQALLDWFGVPDLATWNAMGLEEQRKHHEKFAYSFEAYLHTGKAPSMALQGWFDRFAAWLRNVYKKVRDELNAIFRREFGEDLPILTGEVRQVMDRMLASDEAIEHAATVRGLQPIHTEKPEGWTDEQWADYQARADRAREAGASSLATDALRGVPWLSTVPQELRREAAERRAEVRQEVERQVALEPVYRALRWLRHGLVVNDDGTETQITGPHKLATEAVRALLPEGRKLTEIGGGKYGVTTPDGLDPEAVAEMLGYPSGKALVEALLDAPAFTDAVDRRTDERMLEEHAEFVSAEEVEAAVERALFTEERENVVVAELAGIEAGAATARMVRAAARQQARELVAKRPLSQLRPHLHAVAAGRAAREALRAAARKDKPALAEAKRRELFQIAMARAATEARQEVEKGIKAFDPIWKSDKQLGATKSIGYVHAARAVLARWRLGHGDRTAEDHLSAIATYDPDLHADLLPRVDAATANSRHYRDMTLEEFRDLVVAFESLWYQAGREARYEATGQRQQRDAVAARLAEADADNPTVPPLGGEGGPTGPERRKDWVRSIANLATRPEHWFWRKDRNKPGLFTQLIWRPIRDAVNRYIVERTTYTKRVADMLERLRPHLKAGKIEFLDTNGNHLYTFGRGNGGAGHAELVMALLHTGNRGNLIRLLAGRLWGVYDHETGILDTSHWDAFMQRMIDQGYITPEVMRFVQGVWDLNEELKPKAQEAHRQLSGYYFEEVEAVPQTVRFANGTVETYRGGYMPAKLDKTARSAARLRSLKDLETHFLQQHALTNRGFTKMRAEHFAEPLTLDLSLIPEHVDEVLRYAILQPVTRDVERVMTQRDLRAALERTSPGYWDKLMLPWLQRVASQSATTPSTLGREMDALARAARSSAGIAMMMGNVVNAAQQFLGLATAALRVKPRYLVAAMGRVLAHRRQVYDEIAQASPGFMGERQKGQIYDAVEAVNDIRANRSLVGKAQSWVRRHAYFLQTATQNWVDAIVWQGAYEQAVEAAPRSQTREQVHAEAVQQADAAVRMTQSSFDPTDVARYEAGTPLGKLFTQFSSWFNTMANLNADEYQRVMRLTGAARAGAALEVFFLGFFVPMICSEALTMLLRGQLPEDDDGQLDLAQFGMDLFGGGVRSLGAMVPILGPNIINPATGWLDEKVWNDRLTSSPVMSLLERAGQGTVQAIKTAIDPKKDLAGKNVRDVTTLMGFIFQLPGGTVGRYAGYGIDLATGEVEPTSPYDRVRGILTGTPSKASRK